MILDIIRVVKFQLLKYLRFPSHRVKENRYRDDWNRSKQQRARERDRPINFVVDPAHTLPIVEFHDRAASW